jgi:hypothetical protein
MNDPDGVVALLDAAAFLLGVREWLGLLISWWWEAAVAFAFAAVVIETLYQPGADPENPSKWLRQPSLSRRWRRSLKRSQHRRGFRGKLPRGGTPWSLGGTP